MAEEAKIFIICGNCQGTGKELASADGGPMGPTERECYLCQGTGFVLWGKTIKE